MRRILLHLAILAVYATILIPSAEAGAWPVRRGWNDRVQPANPDSPTYAEAFPAFARETAAAWVRDGVKLDCADFSISLLIAYGDRHGLPVSFKYWSAALARHVTTASTEARFTSRAQYDRFIREAVNAQNLTLNTRAIAYDEWATGDVVLMNWNQSAAEPNFPGRDVWHTFMIGDPGVSVFFGNLDDLNQPLPIVETTEARRIEQITAHADRYGLSPRRYNALTYRAGWNIPERAIEPRSERGYVTASPAVNVRRGPGTGRHAFTTARRGTEVQVTGRWRDWLRVRLPSGETGFVSAVYISATRPVDPAPV